jgi:hypothetical protein
VEAAFPDLVTVAGDGDTTVADFVGIFSRAKRLSPDQQRCVMDDVRDAFNQQSGSSVEGVGCYRIDAVAKG